MHSKIILFLLVSLNYSGLSQTVGLSISQIKTPPQYFYLKNEKIALLGSLCSQNQQVAKTQPRAVPSIFSVETLPFFCKIEYKMGFNKKLPIKFRLGDVQYVDELEGKH